MAASTGFADIDERLRLLISDYSGPELSAAGVLCDRHDPASVAYTIVAPDLSYAEVTYGYLRGESERFAAALFALGIRPGDRVATLMGKSVEYLVAVMGIWRLGAVHVPLFTAFAAPAIAARLSGSRASLVVCDAEQAPKLEPSADIPASVPWRVISVTNGAVPSEREVYAFHDLLRIQSAGFVAAALGGDAPIIHIFTSGTTGRPKGVIVPASALAMMHAYMEFAVGVVADDVLWCAADPGWAYGLYFGILGAFTTGVKSILLKGGFSPELVFPVLQRFEVTNLTAAPTAYRALRVAAIASPGGLMLKRASSAGEPLTPDVNEWAIDALGVRVHDHYGQTEAGMLINNHHHPSLQQPIKTGSMGRAMPGWSAVILEHDSDTIAPTNTVGRVAMIVSQSPLAWFRGYADESEANASKFTSDHRYYLTGDIGRVDEDGSFFFLSREDDVIIMAGYRIGPFEVESVLVTHEAVSECAVIAVPDTVRGEVLEAVVVLRSGFTPSAELTAKLQEWVKKRYAAHAFPRRVHYSHALPKTPSGKVQRFVLRETLRVHGALDTPTPSRAVEANSTS